MGLDSLSKSREVSLGCDRPVRLLGLLKDSSSTLEFAAKVCQAEFLLVPIGDIAVLEREMGIRAPSAKQSVELDESMHFASVQMLRIVRLWELDV